MESTKIELRITYNNVLPINQYNIDLQKRLMMQSGFGDFERAESVQGELEHVKRMIDNGELWYPHSDTGERLMTMTAEEIAESRAKWQEERDAANAEKNACTDQLCQEQREAIEFAYKTILGAEANLREMLDLTMDDARSIDRAEWVLRSAFPSLCERVKRLVAGSQIILPFLIAYVGGFIYFLWRGIEDDDDT